MESDSTQCFRPESQTLYFIPLYRVGLHAEIKRAVWYSAAVLWIQIQWIWIRINNFGLILIRIQGYPCNNFLLKSAFFKNCKKMSLKELFSRLSRWIYILNLTLFASILSLHLRIWIRIQNRDPAPEYGSNTVPDPQHCREDRRRNKSVEVEDRSRGRG